FLADGAGYRGYVIYRPELYARRTVERLAGWLTRVVTAMVEHPDRALRDVEIMTVAEKQRLLGQWSGPARAYVLDADLAPTPPGVLGDLYLGGDPFASARGHGPGAQPRLVADPFSPGALLYRTGDRARWSENGTLDIVWRTTTTEPEVEPATPQPQWEAPRTDTERAIAGLLADLLETEQVGRGDDFFGLGGDSVLAVQVAARARDAGIDLTARMVFEHPEVAALAAAVDAGGADTGPQDSHHAPMSASGLSDDELATLMEDLSG
ncbi:phosphopantetheine-binding protein, partial [Mycolicibacterium sp.]